MFAVMEEDPITVARLDVLALYESVGWTAYTRDPDMLMRSLAGSHRVVTARRDGALIGLARSISDGATVVYVQDILVQPSDQGIGVGRRLLATLLDSYGDIRQCVLLTDGEPRQRALYEGTGFVEASTAAVQAFVRLAPAPPMASQD